MKYNAFKRGHQEPDGRIHRSARASREDFLAMLSIVPALLHSVFSPELAKINLPPGSNPGRTSDRSQAKTIRLAHLVTTPNWRSRSASHSIEW